jgi:hypothetical protein
LSSDAGSPQPFRFEIGIWDVRGHLASDRGRCRCAREIGSERSNPLFAESLSITFDGPQSSECAFPCACDRTGLLQIADFVRRKARIGGVPVPRPGASFFSRLDSPDPRPYREVSLETSADLSCGDTVSVICRLDFCLFVLAGEGSGELNSLIQICAFR